MKKTALLLFFILLSAHSFAQIVKPVSWSYLAKKTSKTEAIVYLKATMEGHWHIYSLDMKGGPTKTSFNFKPSKDFSLIGKVTAPKPIVTYDKTLQLNLSYYEKEVVFSQKIKLNKPTARIKGVLEYMACDKSCIPAQEVEFSIPIK